MAVVEVVVLIANFDVSLTVVIVSNSDILGIPLFISINMKKPSQLTRKLHTFAQYTIINLWITQKTKPN